MVHTYGFCAVLSESIGGDPMDDAWVSWIIANFYSFFFFFNPLVTCVAQKRRFDWLLFIHFSHPLV